MPSIKNFHLTRLSVVPVSKSSAFGKVAISGSTWHLFLFCVNHMVTKYFWRELIFPTFDVRREFSYIIYPRKESSSPILKQHLDLEVTICRVNSLKSTRFVLIFSCVNILRTNYVCKDDDMSYSEINVLLILLNIQHKKNL